MKTLEEAARQALDYWESCGFGDAVMVDKMAALRTALAQPAEQCWKCGDMDPAGHAKCNVPACGMREDTQPAKQEPLTDEETVAQRDELLAAAKHVMEFIEVAHRPPVKDAFEFGRMVRVRLHALAHLHAAIAQVEGEIK